MFKMKNVTVINTMDDFYANVTDEMLQDENIIKIHFKGSDEILALYIFDNEYIINVIDTETYLNVNCLAYDTYDGMVDAIYDAYMD